MYYPLDFCFLFREPLFRCAREKEGTEFNVARLAQGLKADGGAPSAPEAARRKVKGDVQPTHWSSCTRTARRRAEPKSFGVSHGCNQQIRGYFIEGVGPRRQKASIYVFSNSELERIFF